MVTLASKGAAGADETFPFTTALVVTLDVGVASLEGSLLILFGDTGADCVTAGGSAVVTLVVVTAAGSFD